jgi:hypothetical protein
MGKVVVSRPVASSTQNERDRLRLAAAEIQKIRLSAQHELELAKKMRAEAQKYQQEMEAKARSQVQQLLLRTRLATRQAIQQEMEALISKDVEELIHPAIAEIQKMLADIRAIRITAQEELEAQKLITDAARINSLSFKLRESPRETKKTAELEDDFELNESSEPAIKKKS